MNALDLVVLVGSILGITIYGIWYTKHQSDLNSYLKGSGKTPWFSIGLSVMATQASAVTFLSTPGQGYMSGLSFVQIYFGVPLALVIISIFFLPIYRKLNVYTAYEYLERRFDIKTRLLGASLFLLQRGFAAGLTIYAPAIVLTTAFGWPLNETIICCGLLATLYTVLGGSDAVTVTQKYQMAIIFTGMYTAAFLLISKLPAGLTFADTLNLAGGFHRLNAVNFSVNPNERYTIWSGIIGGTFLMLSYFGCDQSQVQRYLSGTSLRESRLGLLFNAVCKIPMQFTILFLGVLLFVFYQFQTPPLFFNTTVDHFMEEHKSDPKVSAYISDFQSCRQEARHNLDNWMQARHKGNKAEADTALAQATLAQERSEAIRTEASKEFAPERSSAQSSDADYVFITFILKQLPHGVIGLLVAAFFAATLSSKSAELNALGASTTIDFYRRLVDPTASDDKSLGLTKWFTTAWGIASIGIALCARLAENLIQAVNIIGSIFYGVMLGLFVVAFFIKRVGGTAIFWAALISQALIFILYFNLQISYLWYPLIGCSACVIISLIFQAALGNNQKAIEEYAS